MPHPDLSGAGLLGLIMKALQFSLSSLEDVHKFFRQYRCHPPTGWWFRGQANSSWPLLPKAGRTEFYLPDNRATGRFKSWSKQAIAYDQNIPQNSWERLAVAQHYGLATCLLDWTYNPLVALYFACAQQPANDGAVYCYFPDLFVKEEKLDMNTAECDGIGFVPRAISRRIIQQRSVFTAHIPTNVPLQVKPIVIIKDHPNLIQLMVPASLKVEIIEMLDDYGINQVTLFPDLEGLSSYINWETAHMVKR
jgi:hypothetical protein